MTVKELDYFFPFIVFGYGFVMTLIFQSGLINLASGRIPEPLIRQFHTNRALGFFCLIIGGLWALQNLLFW